MCTENLIRVDDATETPKIELLWFVLAAVCTENLIRIDAVRDSDKLAE